MEDKSERKVKGPQPSAFVLEMEKQKDLLPTPMPGIPLEWPLTQVYSTLIYFHD